MNRCLCQEIKILLGNETKQTTNTTQQNFICFLMRIELCKILLPNSTTIYYGKRFGLYCSKRTLCTMILCHLKDKTYDFGIWASIFRFTLLNLLYWGYLHHGTRNFKIVPMFKRAIVNNVWWWIIKHLSFLLFHMLHTSSLSALHRPVTPSCDWSQLDVTSTLNHLTSTILYL